MFVRSALFVIAALVSVCPVVTAADVTLKETDAGVRVSVDGELFTEYLKRSGEKPVLYPLLGPTGAAMTRSYPVVDDKVAGEKHDHVHHRSFWFTHGEVNDADFWAEGKGGKQGTIVHREFAKVDDSGPGAVIVTRNDWMQGDRKLCEDERTLTFGADNDQRWIDFDITIKATDGKVEFGDTKEGTFGVRVAGTMKVDAKQGGTIVNSEGDKNAGAWGKQAAWVDYCGPVGDETVGVAIMNHPSSFRYPTYWHVRTYGLFTANPFGLSYFTGNKKSEGSHTLESGETMTLRYRVLLHKGDDKQGQVAEAFNAYSKLQK
jgi:hypothetical protein